MASLEAAGGSTGFDGPPFAGGPPGADQRALNARHAKSLCPCRFAAHFAYIGTQRVDLATQALSLALDLAARAALRTAATSSNTGPSTATRIVITFATPVLYLTVMVPDIPAHNIPPQDERQHVLTMHCGDMLPDCLSVR